LQLQRFNSQSPKKHDTRVLITSELWGTVIAITSGIETSVNSTENVKDFESINKRDYCLKNTFEIYNP
jgi:hypothetical protein